MKDKFNLIMYDAGYDPYTIITTSKAEYMVLKVSKHEGGINGIIEATCIPWKTSKYRIVNWFRITLLKIKLKFKNI